MSVPATPTETETEPLEGAATEAASPTGATRAADEADARPGPDEPPVLISHGARFDGLVSFAGTARIEGEIHGDVIGESGTLLLGPGARVEGDVEVDELVVAGALEGDVRARLRVEVLETGAIQGQLETPLLSVADGGRLQARCATREPGEEPPETDDPDAPIEL
ncbi:MAG: polymer-forming cytoskeletal protein [Myxococcota bacterium]|nr:polymer-forming cytoskeletal protein [Myxococcota bacterium]